MYRDDSIEFSLFDTRRVYVFMLGQQPQQVAVLAALN
jgi:hypothetical protein